MAGKDAKPETGGGAKPLLSRLEILPFSSPPSWLPMVGGAQIDAAGDDWFELYATAYDIAPAPAPAVSPAPAPSVFSLLPRLPATGLLAGIAAVTCLFSQPVFALSCVENCMKEWGADSAPAGRCKDEVANSCDSYCRGEYTPPYSEWTEETKCKLDGTPNEAECFSACESKAKGNSPLELDECKRGWVDSCTQECMDTGTVREFDYGEIMACNDPAPKPEPVIEPSSPPQPAPYPPPEEPCDQYCQIPHDYVLKGCSVGWQNECYAQCEIGNGAPSIEEYCNNPNPVPEPAVTPAPEPGREPRDCIQPCSVPSEYALTECGLNWSESCSQICQSGGEIPTFSPSICAVEPNPPPPQPGPVVGPGPAPPPPSPSPNPTCTASQVTSGTCDCTAACNSATEGMPDNIDQQCVNTWLSSCIAQCEAGQIPGSVTCPTVPPSDPSPMPGPGPVEECVNIVMGQEVPCDPSPPGPYPYIEPYPSPHPYVEPYPGPYPYVEPYPGPYPYVEPYPGPYPYMEPYPSPNPYCEINDCFTARDACFQKYNAQEGTEENNYQPNYAYTCCLQQYDTCANAPVPKSPEVCAAFTCNPPEPSPQPYVCGDSECATTFQNCVAAHGGNPNAPEAQCCQDKYQTCVNAPQPRDASLCSFSCEPVQVCDSNKCMSARDACFASYGAVEPSEENNYQPNAAYTCCLGKYDACMNAPDPKSPDVCGPYVCGPSPNPYVCDDSKCADTFQKCLGNNSDPNSYEYQCCHDNYQACVNEPQPRDAAYCAFTCSPTAYYDYDYDYDYDYEYDYYANCEPISGYGIIDCDDLERLPDAPPMPAFEMDTRYRDMCVGTANLSQSQFNPLTSSLISQTQIPLDKPGNWDPTDCECMTDEQHLNQCCTHDNPRNANAFITGDIGECRVWQSASEFKEHLWNAHRKTCLGYYDEEYDYNFNYGYEDGIPEAISPFHEKFVGRVTGSKPPIGECMPMKDTPLVHTGEGILNVNTDPVSGITDNDDKLTAGGIMGNSAISYYVNLRDVPSASVYADNRYRGLTDFFNTDLFNCFANTDYKKSDTGSRREKIADASAINRDKATSCYNFYILSRAQRPWFTLEKGGPSTDDELSRFDADRAYLSSCQPLINGAQADLLINGPEEGEKDFYKWSNEKKYGYVPVMRYPNMPHWDEAEYHLGTLLNEKWYSQGEWKWWQDPKKAMDEYKLNRFKNVSLPCISEGGEFDEPPFEVLVSMSPYDDQDSGPFETDSCSVDDLGSGLEIVRYWPYRSPERTGPRYCPNVEKINEPSHPFSPRNDIVGLDRDYSRLTGKWVCADDPPQGECKDWRWGYLGATGGSPPNSQPQYPYTEWPIPEQTEKEKVWHVTCGVVPVDILGYRAEAFDSCMRERIDYNFKMWDKAGKPDMRNDTSDPADKPWYKCKTRYWETDDTCDCPVRMSVQQCCRILVKDLVPANFLKMRTCEGKRDKIRNDWEIQRPELLDGPVPVSYYDEYDYEYDDPYNPYDGDAFDPNEDITANPIATNDPVMNGDPNIHIRALRIHKRMKELSCDNSEPQEYRFDYYFKDHMPYMRWWDTGVSAGNKYHGGSFTNTLGMNDTLIGVGREERDEQDAKEASHAAHRQEQMTRRDRVDKEQKSQMGRFGGWAELKAHQMQTIRRYNMSCIGRYEKLFKHGGAEAIALSKAGAGYTSRDQQLWPWPLGWRGYASAGGLGISTDPGYAQKFPRLYRNSWEAQGAVNPAALFTGLDNALPGDIIMYNISGVTHVAYVADIGWDPGASGLRNPTTPFDYAAGKFGAEENHVPPTRLYIISWDQGKFPTSTGMSTMWGMGPERTIYKKDVPSTYRSQICSTEFNALTDKPVLKKFKGEDVWFVEKNDCQTGIKTDNDNNPEDKDGDGKFDDIDCSAEQCQPSCEDTDLSACMLPHPANRREGEEDWRIGWDEAIVYRPHFDTRECVGVDTKDPQFNLPETYRYIPPLKPPVTEEEKKKEEERKKNIILQSQLQTLPSDIWAYCVNAGYDPPPMFSRDYKGAQTGAITDNTLCGPGWGQCSAASPTTRFYPRGWQIFRDLEDGENGQGNINPFQGQ